MKLGPLILLRLLLAIGSSDGAPSGKHALPPSGGVWVKTVVASDSETVQFGARMAAITLQEEEEDSPPSQWTLVNVDGAWRLRAKFPNGRTIKYISASAESEVSLILMLHLFFFLLLLLSFFFVVFSIDAHASSLLLPYASTQ